MFIACLLTSSFKMPTVKEFLPAEYLKNHPSDDRVENIKTEKVSENVELSSSSQKPENNLGHNDFTNLGEEKDIIPNYSATEMNTAKTPIVEAPKQEPSPTPNLTNSNFNKKDSPTPKKETPPIPKKKSGKLAGVLVLLFLVIGTASSYFLVKQNQDLRQQASEFGSWELDPYNHNCPVGTEWFLTGNLCDRECNGDCIGYDNNCCDVGGPGGTNNSDLTDSDCEPGYYVADGACTTNKCPDGTQDYGTNQICEIGCTDGKCEGYNGRCCNRESDNIPQCPPNSTEWRYASECAQKCDGKCVSRTGDETGDDVCCIGSTTNPTTTPTSTPTKTPTNPPTTKTPTPGPTALSCNNIDMLNADNTIMTENDDSSLVLGSQVKFQCSSAGTIVGDVVYEFRILTPGDNLIDLTNTDGITDQNISIAYTIAEYGSFTAQARVCQDNICEAWETLN